MTGRAHHWTQINGTSRLDWHKALEIATTLRVERVLCLSVYMAAEILGPALDYSVLIKKNKIAKFEKIKQKHQQNWKRINERLISRKEQPDQNWFIIYPWHLREMERGVDIFKKQLRSYFIPATVDWSRCKLRYSLSFIYHFYRPGYKAWKYLQSWLLKLILLKRL